MIKQSDIGSGINSISIHNILKKNGFGLNYSDIFRPEPGKTQIFYSDKTITLFSKDGRGEVETIKDRKVIKELNFLHLNTPKKVWTYFADIYAIILIILAFTGLFVLKGKKGIKGRGAWLTVLGILIPVFFVIIYM